MPLARRTLIAGLGLIGGSIGIALRRRGWHVTYIDPGVSLDDAICAGAADERSESFDGTFDITVLATPVDAAIAAIDRCHSLTTSVCSVLQPLRSAAGAHGLDFVAGHPLAGSHERGLAAARADLFEGASWFVDRHIDRDAPVVQDLIACCGARAELVTAAEHDRAVALTSHLPQILSTALAAYLHDQKIDPRFAGSGLRTFLRLAGSAASVWSPIIAANRENIAPHAEAVAEIVQDIVKRGNDEAFAQANAWNAGVPPAGSASSRRRTEDD
jgi:prephenate dehydrogenase